MAKKELLFFVMIRMALFTFANNSIADEIQDAIAVYKHSMEILKASDNKYANEILGIEGEIKTSSSIFKKSSETRFYIFVSFGMGEQNLAQLGILAKKYNGRLIVRGLKDNSFITTATFVQKLVEEEEFNIDIDPTLFQKYQVNKVPTFVLAKVTHCPANMSCELEYDKLVGNITPKYALEQIAKQGDMQIAATKLLEDGKI